MSEDDDSTGGRTRRSFLAATAVAGAAGLGGCLGSSADVVRLESLSVGGSPGGEVPVREPGTPSLVDFFATWCAPCKPQMGTLNALRDSFDGSELHMISVTTERDDDAIRGFWRQYDGNWPVAKDPDLEANQAYEVKGVPTLVLVDGDGEEHWRHRGLAGEDDLRERVGEVVE